MPERETIPSLQDVSELVLQAYVPYGEIERAVPWPSDPENRMENDVEHSWSLAFVACAIANEMGLDVGRVAQLALLHDFVERYAGDTSVWDKERARTKHERETEALKVIKQKHGRFGWIGRTIEEYEEMESEEACLVYALDKLLPVIMIEAGDGHFWKSQGITYKDHLRKVGEVRPKIAKHPVVLAWYERMLDIVEARQSELFAE